ncbi:hypothetical protein Tco_0688417 [Tanacetum coccineum]
MAPESLQTMVIPKFDMHIHTSTLTTKELKQVIKEYCILTDLRPRLPSLDLTIDKLSLNVIGIYLMPIDVNRVIMFEGHWFSFENKTGGRSKKCFKEITSSLKGWKKKFFLIDQRAIPDAMPWRHIDTDVHDDFSVNYNEGDADRLAEHIILLRKPPQRLLYMRGLTTNCRHPKLAQVIKDPEGQAKRAGEASSEALQKKKVQKIGEPAGLKSERTISVTPLHQADLKPLNEATESRPNDIEKNVVEHGNTQEYVDLFDAHSFHSVHDEDNDKDTDEHRFAELLKRHERLNHDHLELLNRDETQLVELNRSRIWSGRGMNGDEQRLIRWKKENNLKETLGLSLKSYSILRDFVLTAISRLITSVEYQKSLAVPIGLCFSAGWLVGLSLGQKEEEIDVVTTNTNNLNIEGLKVCKEKYHELFTMQYPYIQKIVDSYRLLFDALMKVCPDVHPPSMEDQDGPSVENDRNGLPKADSSRPARSRLLLKLLRRQLFDSCDLCLLFDFFILNNGDTFLWHVIDVSM